jgi:hypothetical protein
MLVKSQVFGILFHQPYQNHASLTKENSLEEGAAIYPVICQYFSS